MTSPAGGFTSTTTSWISARTMRFFRRTSVSGQFHAVSSLGARSSNSSFVGVYGELLIRQATGHATLLHPFLYVIDSKRALSFGEAVCPGKVDMFSRR